MKGKIAATALLLLLLTFGAEAQLCKFRSQKFKGECFHSDNCAAVCVTENYTSGYCHGPMLPRVCLCTMPCGGVGGGGGENPPGGGGEYPPGGGGEDPPGGELPPPDDGGYAPPAKSTARARRAGGHA